MKSIAVSIIILITGIGWAFAQEPADDPNAWKTSVELGIGLNQATYSDNWEGGEVGSVIWAANLHATAEKKITSRWKSENDLKLAFGQTHSQVQETKQWLAPVKSTDKIRFDALLKYTPGWYLDPYIAFVFQSQFYDDVSIPGERYYINPMELTESIGGSRTIFEDDEGKLATRLGFGLRQNFFKTYDLDTVDDTTDVKGDMTYDGGIEWVTDFDRKMSETMSYTSKLTVFKALFYSESDNVENDYWKTPDVTWENILTAKVWEFVQVNLAWELWYDKEVSLAGRFKETLSLGVAWVL